MARKLEINKKIDGVLHIYVDSEDDGVGVSAAAINECREDEGRYVNTLVLHITKELDRLYELTKLESELFMALLHSALKDENTKRWAKNFN